MNFNRNSIRKPHACFVRMSVIRQLKKNSEKNQQNKLESPQKPLQLVQPTDFDRKNFHNRAIKNNLSKLHHNCALAMNLSFKTFRISLDDFAFFQRIFQRAN